MLLVRHKKGNIILFHRQSTLYKIISKFKKSADRQQLKQILRLFIINKKINISLARC